MTVKAYARQAMTLARQRYFPWQPSLRMRRALGVVGFAWGALTLWAVGVLMGAGAFWHPRTISPGQLWAGLLFHSIGAALLIRQRPGRSP